MRGYFKNHWAGRLGFGLTLFGNLLGISFVVASVAIKGWPIWVENLGVVIVVALLVWQVVGGLRRAKREQAEQGASNNAWMLYLGVSTAVVLMGFQVLDVAAARYFIEPRTKTIFGNDDFSAKLKGNSIHLGGEVNYLMYQALLIMLNKHPNVTTISLESNGGIVFAGRSIAKLLEARSLTTQVKTYCYSVCTLVFAAGKKRMLLPGAEVGFHGYSFDIPYRYQTVDPVAEQQKDMAYLMARGIDCGFLKHAFSIGATNLWKPSRAKLFDAGFITEP